MILISNESTKRNWDEGLGNIQFALLSVFIFTNVLYYFLRFQFSLQVEVPVLLYSTVIILIVVSMLRWFHTKEHSFSDLDKVMITFFLYSIILVISSWYLYGFMEFLYSIKNYITGFIIYFIISFTLPRKDAWPLFLVALSVLAAVAIIYTAEYVSVHFFGEVKDIVHVPGAVFGYTSELDKYAYSLGAPHGIAMPWYQGENQIWFRLPGPLGYPNITGVALGFGLIISACMLLVQYHRLYVLALSSLFVFALLASGSRTAIAATAAGLLVIMAFNVRRNYKLVMAMLALGALILMLLIITGAIIGKEGVSGFYSWQAIESVVKYLFGTQVWSLFIDNIADYLILGKGFYPTTIYLDGAVSGVDVSMNIGPILTTDLYFVQVLTTYGILPSIIFLMLLFRALWLTQKSIPCMHGKESSRIKIIFFSILGLTVAGTLSTFHVNAMGSVQLLPLTMLFFAILSRKCKGHARTGVRKNIESELNHA